jgi:hypothetical protein
MGDTVPRQAQGRELNQETEAEKPDQRKRLRSTLMTSAGIAYVLEDTPPFLPAPTRRMTRLGPETDGWKAGYRGSVSGANFTFGSRLPRPLAKTSNPEAPVEP